MNKESGFVWKLGMFVIIALVLFTAGIYFVGKQKNLFGSTFHLQARFNNVSGLKIGNNVRFSGINIGTISEIDLITDTSVVVQLIIKKEIQQFIKTDAIASIGSDGLMGDKVLTISPGTVANPPVKDNAMIASRNAIEMEDIMNSVKASVDNAGLITEQLAQFSYKMNNGNGTLAKLITDEEFSNSLKKTLFNLQTSSKEFATFTIKMNDGKGALSRLVNDEEFSKTLDSTMTNLQTGSKGLSDNMEAAKHNILLKGYFKKQKKAAVKKQETLKKKQDLKQKNEIKNTGQPDRKTDSTNMILNAKDSVLQ